MLVAECVVDVIPVAVCVCDVFIIWYGIRIVDTIPKPCEVENESCKLLHRFEEGLFDRR